MMPAIDYIASKPEMRSLNTLLLTDGYIDTLNLSGLNGKFLVISNGVECAISSSSRNVKQIVVDENYN